MLILATLPDPDHRGRYLRCAVDRLPVGSERVKATYWSDGITLPIRGWVYRYPRHDDLFRAALYAVRNSVNYRARRKLRQRRDLG